MERWDALFLILAEGIDPHSFGAGAEGDDAGIWLHLTIDGNLSSAATLWANAIIATFGW